MSTPEGPAYDAVVVGGGPAGLSAATWLARYRARVLVVDESEHRNRWVEQAHGYLGEDPVVPSDLRERACKQLAAYPEAELRSEAVGGVSREGDGPFVVQLASGPVTGRRLVLATGVVDRFPEVERFFDHYGADVFHCPTCDGYEAKDRQIVVFGWNAEVTGFALSLKGWAGAVTVVTDGRHFEGDQGQCEALAEAGIAIVEDDAVELLGTRGDMKGVRLRSGGRLDCELAFFSIAHEPRVDLALQLGCALTEEGCVEVDHQCATTAPGVFAAGDITPGLQLVQVAAAKGAIAGVACARSLRGEGEVPELWKGRLPG